MLVKAQDKPLHAHHRSWMVLLFVLLPWVSSSGQSEWSLDRCLAVARERSPRLQAARNTARSTQLEQSELSTTRLPQMKLSGGSILAPTRGNLGYDPAITNGGEIAGQVVVQQSLYDAGMRGLKLDQMQVEIEQRQGEFRLADRDLTLAVRQSFIDYLHAEAEARLQQESVDQLTDYLGVVQRLNKGGTASYTDVLKTQVMLADARTSLQKAVESAQVAKISLGELIGISSDSLISLTGSLEDLVPSHTLSDSFSSSQEPLENLETSLSASELRRSLFDIELAQREAWPTLSLIGDGGILASGDNLQLPPSERVPVVGYSVGISLEVPLLNWGATDLRVQQRQLASENARLRSELVLRSLHSEIRKLSLQLSNARARLASSRGNIKAAEENFLLTKSKYTAGASLSLEVLSAQQLLTETRLAETQALADIQSINARIDQLLTK